MYSTREEPFHVVSVPSATPWHFGRALAALRPQLTIVGHAHPRLLLPSALLSKGRYIASNARQRLSKPRNGAGMAPIFNRLLAGARFLVTNSRANAQRLQELGLPAPELILPGTDPHRFTPSSPPLTGPPVLLTVARLVSRKGFDTVLRAMPPLLEMAPRLQYWIVGDGPARPKLEQLAQDLQLTEAVRFLNSVADSDLPGLYRRASIFVMAAREEYDGPDGAASVEGFGIVYLEASASGLPVVAARSRGAAEAVREGETGLLTPPDDPAALTQALALLHRMTQTCAAAWAARDAAGSSAT